MIPAGGKLSRLPIAISPSLACADFLHFEQDLRDLEAAGVEYLHVDVMDGQYVPNFSLNADIMKAVVRVTAVPQDVHLMIDRPERYLEMFVKAGAGYLTVHAEATLHLQRTLAEIRRLGARAGVALAPATPLTALDYILDDIDLLVIMTVNPGFYAQKLVPATLGKIAEARALLDRHGLAVPIEVDGNVSFENAPKMVAAGANWLVGGTSSVFKAGLSRAEGVRKLRELATGARLQAA
jgi:ribulose-phosphate 3-epimerase